MCGRFPLAVGDSGIAEERNVTGRGAADRFRALLSLVFDGRHLLHPSWITTILD